MSLFYFFLVIRHEAALPYSVCHSLSIRTTFSINEAPLAGAQRAGVTFLFDVFAVRLLAPKLGIVILTLIPQDMIIIKPFRFALHVPFPYHARLIAILLKYFGQEEDD